MSRNVIADRIPPEDLFVARFTRAEEGSLRNLAGSRDPRDRRLCVEYLACCGRPGPSFLGIADLLVRDRRESVRWAVLVLVGLNYAEENPQAAWPFVARWGSAPSRDLRIGVACCVLEHILQQDFARYFPKARKIVEEGNRRFALTLLYCRKDGDSAEPRNAAAFDEYVATLDRARREKEKYDAAGRRRSTRSPGSGAPTRGSSRRSAGRGHRT